MKRRIVPVVMLLCLICLVSSPMAGTIYEVVADSTLDGHLGYIFNVSEDDVHQGALFLFEEDGYIRAYSKRNSGGDWQDFAGVCRIVKTSDLAVGDSWLSPTHEDLGSMSSIVEAFRTVTVPAGTYDAAKIASYPTMSPGSVDSYTWFVDGVGVVIERELNGSPWLVLKSYHLEGGSGCLPLTAGNRWEYESGTPIANEQLGLGAVKALFHR